MKKREQVFLEKAIEYKKMYKQCSWWKFRRRRELYRLWKSSLGLMVKYSADSISKHYI